MLIVGGTARTPGAVLLAGEAVLRAGAGKLQVATAESVAAQLAVTVPEALVVPLPMTPAGDIAEVAAEEILGLADGADTILIGPGFSDLTASMALLSQFIPQVSKPIVLDALASAYIGQNRDGLSHLKGLSVVTVNPEELAQTLDVPEAGVEQQTPEATLRLSCETGAVVLCGGQDKVVAAPSGQLWVSDLGGPGLGVSGSGDVQAGLVAGLLGRGADPDQAAVWGGYLHARAGEQLARRIGEVGFLAREIAGEIPGILTDLKGELNS